MTGRSRPFDRALIWDRYGDVIKLDGNCQPDHPVFVVATQCIEVGANIDFDSLVTEIAPIDALEQRFGRLNRDGRAIEAQAAIVAQANQTATKYDDAVYGKSIAETWRWLKEHANAGKGAKKSKSKAKELVLDMGVAAFRAVAPTGSERARLCADSPRAPVLLPAHIDRFSETAPIPAFEPDPALFLHGPQAGPADVLVVWRADLEGADRDAWPDIVSRVPPRAEEALAVPIWAVRRWLAKDSQASTELTDLEGVAEPISESRDRIRPVLHWRGAESSEAPTDNAQRVRPGMMIVVPASYGACDRWGWDPAYEGMVSDVADFVSLDREKPSLRLHPAIVVRWWADVPPADADELVKTVRASDTVAEIRAALSVLAERSDIDHRIRRATVRLAVISKLRVFRGEPDEDGFSQLEAVAAMQDLEQEDVTSSYTDRVSLCAHLEHCRSQADRYVNLLKLPAILANTVRRAAALHDIGKADERFQAMLRGGVPRARLSRCWRNRDSTARTGLPYTVFERRQDTPRALVTSCNRWP